MKTPAHLFGPVPSRRFGRSLGVDLTPYKTCSFDCVFCQLGRTTNKTLDRREYVPTEQVIEELRQWLAAGGQADYITLSGSGEPTLHSRFGEVIDAVRRFGPMACAVLTNGTLLDQQSVREAAARADVVKISLSAWGSESFQRVNRPHEKLRFERLLDGMVRFRSVFDGQIWLEVFLLSGINDHPDDVVKLAALAERIGPDRIHLNTVVRPPAEPIAEPVSTDRLAMLCRLFRPAAEVIAEVDICCDPKISINAETIFSMLQRRPCTSEQIAKGFGMHFNEVSKYLGYLVRSGRVREVRKNGLVHYAVERAPDIDDGPPGGTY
ncbi:MAG: radical SAM protein [Desulfobacterales bacterium]|jgi:wyosine [tRNA(Phe)-imidazoG37] synthetase (radical SAM superfamily)